MTPNDPMNDIEADVRQTARQLSHLDFSTQSQQRDSTRERLMDQMYRQKPAPNKEWWQQQTSRRRTSLFATIGAVAAAFLLGIIVVKLPVTDGAAAVAEAIVLTPERGGVPFALPNMAMRFYDTLDEAASAVDVPVFVPGAILSEMSDTFPSPEQNTTDAMSGLSPDDMLNFVTVSSISDRTPPYIITSVYFKKTRWRISVMNGYARDDNMDYLYVMQEDQTPSGLSQLVRLFRLLAVSDTSQMSQTPHRGEKFVADGLDGYQLVLAYEEDQIFLLASRVMSDEKLVAVADSLEPFPTIAAPFAPDEPGSCPDVKAGYGTGWVLPMVEGSYQIQNRFSASHSGIDLVAPEGTMVRAAADGTVVFAGESTYGYGNAVVLSHGTTYTMYAHLSAVSVQCGQSVTALSSIGFVGSTGNSSGPHLHFEVINSKDWTRIDPSTILDF